MMVRIAPILRLAHLVVAGAVLAYAVSHLALNPNIERAVLMYFVPPLLALLIIAINLIRGTNPDVIVLGELLLDMIAIAVLLGEHPFFGRILKPQFPGMPPQQDHVLVCYFIAYFLFFLFVLPPYLLGVSLRRHCRRLPAAISFPTCCVGAITWLGTMALIVSLIPTISAKLF